MAKIAFILGTRPEAIKLAPVILRLKSESIHNVQVCVTGQHKEMLYQVLDLFNISPDVDLQLMQVNQTLVSLNAAALISVDQYLKDQNPDLVLVQGDTTTVFAAALAAFYSKIPVGHVEAGLRTFNKYSPYPEEINRVLTTSLADHHFAPTTTSKNNLLAQNVNPEAIHVTGNTVIDALYMVKEKLDAGELSCDDGLFNIPEGKKIVLITAHRRENFGDGIDNICAALAKLATRYPDLFFIYPVHLNPNIKGPVNKMLAGIKNISLIEPLDYVNFIALMSRSYLILTDSGGVQEEAPSLGKPVLVMRENSERPEAIEAGTVKLVGSSVDAIVENTSFLIDSTEEYDKMARAINPYGDGKASERICDIINKLFN
ncbi:MAG: non-hydrolyzing UDP-N-acetylglucosamine 2-epimerase [Flavisolibacter sp.]